MPITAGVVGGLGALGTIGGSLIQNNAISHANDAQQTAAQKVIQMANTAGTAATGDVNSATSSANTGLLAAQGQGNQVISGALQQQLQALAPYIQSGQVSLTQLQQMLGPNGPLAGPQNQFSFNPTTSPQLQFEQQQANQALTRTDAAAGIAPGSGGAIRASDALNTGLTSTYLNQAFNQALATYNTNRQNTLTQIQGLTNLTGLGFNATGAENQDIGAAGQQTNANIQNSMRQQAANTIAAGNYAGNTTINTAGVDEGATIAAANSQSAADLGKGNLWSGLTTGLLSNAAGLYGLSQSPNFGGGGGPSPLGNPTVANGGLEGIQGGGPSGSIGDDGWTV